MDKRVDYYFATSSPLMYLGHERLVAIARRHGASIAVKPVDFDELFPVSGGPPLSKRVPQRQAYRLVKLRRWSEHLGIPLNLQPRFFPVQRRSRRALDPRGRRAASAEIAARYKALTDAAIHRQVFGAPTYIYRDELYRGQDRLDFLDRALAK